MSVLKRLLMVILVMVSFFGIGFSAEEVKRHTNIIGYQAVEGSAAEALLKFVNLIKKSKFDEAKTFCSEYRIKFYDRFGGMEAQKWIKRLVQSDFSKYAKFYVKDVAPDEVRVDVTFYSIQKGGKVGANFTMKKIEGKWLFD